jgi:hypothetical protein
MSSNENSVSARQIRGELCNFTDIRGVKSLKSNTGLDIINVAENLHDQLVKFTKLMSEVSERVSTLENKLNGTGPAPKLSSDLVDRLTAIEKSIADGSLRGPMGPAGPAGADGVDGRDGLKGERGPRGVVEKLRDIQDVDLNGLTDGAILVYRKNKWVVEVTEE